jgi:AraC-like DNA-binding protein
MATKKKGARTTRAKKPRLLTSEDAARLAREAVNAERKRLGIPVDSKTGRPRERLDWPRIDGMLACFATLEEVASQLDVSEDTIERACKAERKMSFAEYSRLKRGKGRLSLRRRQMLVALGNKKENVAPNVTMLIWLGKQHLDQTDKLQHIDPMTAKSELAKLLGVEPSELDK